MKRTITPKTRTFIFILGAFVLLAILLLAGGLFGGRDSTDTRALTTEGRTDFLAEYGWTADPDSEQTAEIHIPEVFSPVYEDYNALQLAQGYDLTPYAGKDCTLYTYAVTNWPDDSQTVVANLYVYRGEIIGGDVHSTNLGGFMVGLK